jgi:hypothetical protein
VRPRAPLRSLETRNVVAKRRAPKNPVAYR